jgi:hypothetical protein
MAKIIIKDGEISSSAGINIPGSLTISGNVTIGDNFTDTLIINSSTTFNDDLIVIDTISSSVGRFTVISGSISGSTARFTSITGTLNGNITGNAATVTSGVYTSTIGSFATTGVTAGNGLTGGGTTGSLTLNVGAGDGISVSADSIAVDGTVVRTTGTQSIAGIKTFSDDIAINGGDLTTTAETFNLLNTNASIINVGGSADEYNLSTNNSSTPTTFNITGFGTNQVRLRNVTGSIIDNADIGMFNVLAPSSSASGAGLSTKGGIRVRWDGTSAAGKVATVVGNASSNTVTTITTTSTSGLTINNGNLIIGTSGNGVNFSIDSSAIGMTGELLDDYEKGTWTPSFNATGTSWGYSAQTGEYIKIGSLVFASFNITTNNISGPNTNTLSITGLPFASSTSNFSTCQVWWLGIPTAVISMYGLLASSATGIVLYAATTTAQVSSLTMPSNYTDGGCTIRGSMVYRTT